MLLMFCDFPTSALDAFSKNKIINFCNDEKIAKILNSRAQKKISNIGDKSICLALNLSAVDSMIRTECGDSECNLV